MISVREIGYVRRSEPTTVLGNVLTRADANENLTETFTYDNLNRVTSATVSQSVAPVKTFAYDAIGNLLSKSDVGNYTYPLAG
jgi:RHS Repeat